MSFPRLLCFSAAMLAFAGCSSARGSLTPAAVSQATAAPHDASATIRIKVPLKTPSSSARSTKYVSYATQSIQIDVDPGTANESDQEVDLTSSSPNCTPSGVLGYLTCSIPVAVATGTHTANAITYDKTGGAKGGGAVLSAQYGYPFTIQTGVVNTIAFTLGGIPTAVFAGAVSPQVSNVGNATFAFDAGETETLLVYALDADQNTIVGPGSPTITVKPVGTAVTVSTTASNPNAFAVTVQQPNVTAAGLSVSVADASGSGASPLTSTLIISPIYTTSPILTNCSASANCTVASGALTYHGLTASEANYTGAFTYSASSPAGCIATAAAPAGIADVTAPSGLGPCTVTVTDRFGNSGTAQIFFDSTIRASSDATIDCSKHSSGPCTIGTLPTLTSTFASALISPADPQNFSGAARNCSSTGFVQFGSFNDYTTINGANSAQTSTPPWNYEESIQDEVSGPNGGANFELEISGGIANGRVIPQPSADEFSSQSSGTAPAAVTTTCNVFFVDQAGGSVIVPFHILQPPE
jgi:hypothetical protein